MVQSDGRRIARKYAFSYLIPDLLATIPFDQLPGGEEGALAALGLLRFLRIRRIITWFGTIERSETVSYHTVAIIKFVFLLLCNGHTAACCFFFLSRLEDHEGGKTWVGELCPEIIEDSLWKQYETSFYWAVTTLSTVGYGDVSPVSGSERIAVAFWVTATTALHRRPLPQPKPTPPRLAALLRHTHHIKTISFTPYTESYILLITC